MTNNMNQHFLVQGGYDQEGRLTSIDDFGFINATTKDKVFKQFDETHKINVQLIQKVITVSDDYYDADNIERESMVLGKNENAIVHGFDFDKENGKRILTVEEAQELDKSFDYDITGKTVNVFDEEYDEDESGLCTSETYIDTFKSFGYTMVVVQMLNGHNYIFKSKFDFEATFKELDFFASKAMPDYNKRGSMSYDANENTYFNATLNEIVKHMLRFPENFELVTGKFILYDGFNGDLMDFDVTEHQINENFTIEEELINFEDIKEIPLESLIAFIDSKFGGKTTVTKKNNGIHLDPKSSVIKAEIPYDVLDETHKILIVDKFEKCKFIVPYIYNGDDLQNLVVKFVGGKK